MFLFRIFRELISQAPSATVFQSINSSLEIIDRTSRWSTWLVLGWHYWNTRNSLLTATRLLHFWIVRLWHVLWVWHLRWRHLILGVWVLRLRISLWLWHSSHRLRIILRSSWRCIDRWSSTEMSAARRVLRRRIEWLLLVQNVEICHVGLRCICWYWAIRSNSTSLRRLHSFS